jgi:hypothetical protein
MREQVPAALSRLPCHGHCGPRAFAVMGPCFKFGAGLSTHCAGAALLRVRTPKGSASGLEDFQQSVESARFDGDHGLSAHRWLGVIGH